MLTFPGAEKYAFGLLRILGRAGIWWATESSGPGSGSASPAWEEILEAEMFSEGRAFIIGAVDAAFLKSWHEMVDDVIQARGNYPGSPKNREAFMGRDP